MNFFKQQWSKLLVKWIIIRVSNVQNKPIGWCNWRTYTIDMQIFRVMETSGFFLQSFDYVRSEIKVIIAWKTCRRKKEQRSLRVCNKQFCEFLVSQGNREVWTIFFWTQRSGFTIFIVIASAICEWRILNIREDPTETK